MVYCLKKEKKKLHPDSDGAFINIKMNALCGTYNIIICWQIFGLITPPKLL